MIVPGGETMAEVRLREKAGIVREHVAAAVAKAREAVAADDPLRALALLDLATDDLMAATEHARQRAVMAQAARRPGGAS